GHQRPLCPGDTLPRLHRRACLGSQASVTGAPAAPAPPCTARPASPLDPDPQPWQIALEVRTSKVSGGGERNGRIQDREDHMASYRPTPEFLLQDEHALRQLFAPTHALAIQKCQTRLG